jgi:hypothetical protein
MMDVTVGLFVGQVKSELYKAGKGIDEWTLISKG